MSGREVLAQVRGALELRRVMRGSARAIGNYKMSAALAALDGCVLLTAEEAAHLQTLLDCECGRFPCAVCKPTQDVLRCAALMLEAEDVGVGRDEAEVLSDLAQEKADRLLKDLP